MDAKQIVITAVLTVVVVFLMDRAMSVYLKWRLRAAGTKSRSGKPVSKEDPKEGRIEMSPDAVRVAHPKSGVAEVPWNAITRLVAFKRDVFIVDLICLQLTYGERGQQKCLEVHEEMLGFQNLIDALPSRFPLRDENWWYKVAFPAFVPNATTLWEKQDPATA
jgi:hypothetical protein